MSPLHPKFTIGFVVKVHIVREDNTIVRLVFSKGSLYNGFDFFELETPDRMSSYSPRVLDNRDIKSTTLYLSLA